MGNTKDNGVIEGWFVIDLNVKLPKKFQTTSALKYF